MKIDLIKLQNELTSEQIIKILYSLGATNYYEHEEYLIFPTICHNDNEEEASMKLYYYFNSHLFHCYTECGDSFNIFTLVEKVFTIKNYNNGKFNFNDCLSFILHCANIKEEIEFDTPKYESKKEKYERKCRTVEVPTYSNELVNVFSKIYPIEWKEENIQEKSMDKFNIRYSISQNKIIIPHYNIDGDLIGIRGRTLNKEEIELYGKYMPIKIEDKIYSHPLSQNLYGLNITKEDIKKERRVVLFEAEKSVLLYDGYFESNTAAAVCGSNFNKAQLDILLKHFNLQEIIIAFDKEYTCAADKTGERYFNKLMALCKKYQMYCKFSFIFDRENLLELKDSPIDKGKDVFLRLMDTRVII